MKSQRYMIIDIVFFITFIVVFPLVLGFALLYLKTLLFFKHEDIAFYPVAGWGTMILPLGFIGIASALLILRRMHRIRDLEDNDPLNSPVTSVIGLGIMIPMIIVMVFLFDSYRRITVTGIEVNPVVGWSMTHNWKDLKTAKLGLFKKKVSSGKYSTRDAVLLSFIVSFPDEEIDLVEPGDAGPEFVNRIKKIIDVIKSDSLCGLTVVRGGEEEKRLFNELAEWKRDELTDIMNYALKAED